MKDITIEQYKNLNGLQRLEYDALNSLKHSDTFNGIKLNTNKMSWSEVKGVMRTLKDFGNWKNVVDIYETCFNITEDVFWQSSILEYFATKPYIAHAFRTLKENELRLLHSGEFNQILWQSAGGKRLDRFGDIIPLKQLGEIYGVYPLELGKKLYQEILSLAIMHKTSNEVQAKFDELRAQSQKLNKS